MSKTATLLETLRSKTFVDCDTLDIVVAKALGPFQDCTSNQIIAYHEMQKHEHIGLLRESVKWAKELENGLSCFVEKTEELAVEIAMTKLALRMLPYVKGFVHVQTNPMSSYQTGKMVDQARRILQIVQRLEPSIDAKARVCIKIPSTWEGLQACRQLEGEGISTLATTLFSMTQAVLAGHVGCRYIAPYVYDLRTQVEDSYKDDSPIHGLCVEAQRYYNKHDLKTKVLPASLTTSTDAMLLAGADHMTIAPHILQDLQSIESLDDPSSTKSLYEATGTKEGKPIRGNELAGEDSFRLALTLEDGGKREAKMSQAISIFCETQAKFEAVIRPLCQA